MFGSVGILVLALEFHSVGSAALEGRYRVEREPGEGGTALGAGRLRSGNGFSPEGARLTWERLPVAMS